MDRALFDAGFDALTPGDRFTSERRQVTEADVDAFAALTGDHHPQHTDAAWAAGSVFGERVAHGLLVLSCAAGLVPFDPDRVLALRRIADVVFKRPVLLGDEIAVEARVRATTPLDDETGLVEIGLRVVDGRGRLAVRAVLHVIWRRASARATRP